MASLSFLRKSNFEDDPHRPRGWTWNPSSLHDRAPIVAAAFLGLTLEARANNVFDFYLKSIFVAVLIIGAIGGARRWLTMPWLVLLFGILIGPLNFALSTGSLVTMAIYETWNTSAVVRAALGLLIIGPAFDEVLASLQYLRGQLRRGRSIFRAMLGLKSADQKEIRAT